jgi:transcriptional regulator with XRE-family HTH domain
MSRMNQHESFGDALKRAIDDAGLTQAKVAKQLAVDPSQVSRWATNSAKPHRDNVRRLSDLLKRDLTSAFIASAPPHELYVSAPITGLHEAVLAEHHGLVARVVQAARQHVNELYWPGEQIQSTDDLSAPDLATEENMKALGHCEALLFLQFAEVVHPSSAYIELGIALGLKKKTTIIVQQDLHRAFMLHEFGAVAERIGFLPKARVYPVKDVDAATKLVANRNARALLGLT